MDGQTVIDTYQEISAITAEMLAAARARDWDRLATLEGRCSVKVDLLRSRESATRLSEEERSAKVRLIGKILEDDRAIRGITEPWMDDLNALISSARHERQLVRAYGPGSGPTG